MRSSRTQRENEPLAAEFVLAGERKPADTAAPRNTGARAAGGTTAKSNGLTWIRINGI